MFGWSWGGVKRNAAARRPATLWVEARRLKVGHPKQARAPLTIYTGARASRLEAVPRRQYEPKGLLGSSLAGQLLSAAAKAWTAYYL